jgi:hypothetical protein
VCEGRDLVEVGLLGTVAFGHFLAGQGCAPDLGVRGRHGGIGKGGGIGRAAHPYAHGEHLGWVRGPDKPCPWGR